MKLKYNEIQIQLVMFNEQDVLTMSGFKGEEDLFETPNPNPVGDF